MTTTTKKPTKKENYNTILGILTFAEENGAQLPEGTTYETLREFAEHELELLETKAAAAQKRAADKKQEGDALRDRIYEVLSTEDYMTISEIVAALGDPDVSNQMATARLKQLSDLNQVEKDMVSVPAATEGGKAKKLSAYRRLA